MRAAAAAALTGLALLLAGPGAAAARTLVVAPDGPYPELTAALVEARPGDTVEVRGGVHPGPVTVPGGVRLVGVGWPVLDGDDRGTVVELPGAGASLEGFVVRSSGTSLEHEDAGVSVSAEDVVVAGNRIERVLFGIVLANAHRATIRDNVITGRPELPEPRRGDLVKLWYSEDVLIEDNRIERGRDVVLWYSERLTLRGNVIRGGRYGLHFMFCDDALVERNRLEESSVGAYLMYSRRLVMRDNVIRSNRGPSGYGVGLKELDDVLLEGNLVADNRVGVFVDNSPFSEDSYVRYRGNAFVLNDIGLELMPSTRRNHFTGNTFSDNGTQVWVSGGGDLQANDWADGGTGNYWSDYSGYDGNGDGRGDVPYRSQRLFEGLAEREPLLRLFNDGLAAGAIDLAARAFPVVPPKTNLTDPAPLVRPAELTGLPAADESGSTVLAPASGGLVALALGIALWPRLRPRRKRRERVRARAGVDPAGPPIAVEGLTKRYGEVEAVAGLDLTVRAGEAVALCGPNGAGKTTILRSLLGLLRFDGAVRIGGLDVREHGREARRLIGFVPQELDFHDELGTLETARFYARLRGAPLERAEELLERLGLDEHAAKPVGQLSGGMRQKLALAVALLSDPPVLLLDEPTASLDARTRRELLALLSGLKAAGKALVFASHRLDEVAALADRVLVLERGRPVAAGTPAEVAGRLGRGAVLHLAVEDGVAGEALAALVAAGFAASANGRGIEVRTQPGERAAPIALLGRRGIAVRDFEVEE